MKEADCIMLIISAKLNLYILEISVTNNFGFQMKRSSGRFSHILFE
ncbi:hypothetical protein EI77_04079 [Prosthecobacter fusiformis]|uniref:Uncharacterized protein n=1 Tax=Prosthecobacter fusiformis TaxID=48464 RepID=A0A4R7RKD1_9BACT|nr:hypothetical protein EI77_04079 [Prosthecobacter fusiformis]